LKFQESIENENTIIAVYIQCLLCTENPITITPKLVLLPVFSLSSAKIREFPLKVCPTTLVINAKIEYIYSAIMQQLIISPECLLNTNISTLPFDCIEFLVSLDNLNVKDEDFVLEIVGNWTESTELKPNEFEMKNILTCIK
jgi:BTB And C-terminal Kelch.